MNWKSRLAFILSLISVLTTSAFADVYVFFDQSNTKIITNIKPEWWSSEMDQLEPESIRAPDSDGLPGLFVGDKENHKFHRPLCEQIYNSEGKIAIPDQKIIWFQTADEAASQNFIPCDHCKPLEAPGKPNG